MPVWTQTRSISLTPACPLHFFFLQPGSYPAMSLSLCPCCSNKIYKQCCGRFLLGLNTPRTVQQLMRSRFTAYSLGGHGEYLLATWHPDTRPPLTATELSAQEWSAQEVQWQRLQILTSEQHGDEGTVELKATFVDSNGNAATHHELSRVVRLAGKWLYVDGTHSTVHATAVEE